MCRKKKIDRKRNVSDNELREIVSNKLSTSLIKVGYRQMTETISVKYNVNTVDPRFYEHGFYRIPQYIEQKVTVPSIWLTKLS